MYPDNVQSQEAPLNYGMDEEIQMGPALGWKAFSYPDCRMYNKKELYLCKAMRYTCYGILHALKRWSISPLLHLKGGGYKASELHRVPHQKNGH